MISFELEEEVKELQGTAKKFAENEIRPSARDAEKAGKVSEELNKKYFDLGVGLIDYPEKVCGMACPIFWNVVLQEEIGYGDMAVATALCGPGHAGAAIMAFGTEEQQERLLAPFADADGFSKRGAIAFLEEDRGLPLSDMKVTAKKKGDKWEINGKKAYVLGGGGANLIVVFAKVGDGKGWNGIKAFAVEKGASGLVVSEPKRLMGLNALDVVDINFDECSVPAANLLDGQPDTLKGIVTMMDRISVVEGARLLGMGRAAAEYAIGYSQERMAFGKPIGHFQSLAFLMSDMTIEVNAARWTLWRAASAVDLGLENAHQIVAQAMAQINQMSLFVTNNAVQILGGHGFIQDHPVEKWMRDARAATVLFGNTHLQNLVIARGEFTGPPAA